MARINYIIASWNGQRISDGNVEYYENVLKNHLKIFNNISNSISQITIMKPASGVVNSYYDIDSEVKELKTSVKVVECENKYQSYGQWLKAVELFHESFDYFIFIEDDYVPGTDNFGKKFIEIYKEGTYLSGLVELVNNPGHFQAHSAISNGFISKNTIYPLLSSLNYDDWLRKYGELYPRRIQFGGNYQKAFSRYFQENGIGLVEYRNQYEVEFNNHNGIKNYSSPTAKPEALITPIQRVLTDNYQHLPVT